MTTARLSKADHTFAPKRRRRRTSIPHHFYFHRTIHRVSMERNLQNEVAGRGLKILAYSVLFAVGLGLLLFSLYVVLGGVPNPAPPKACCVSVP